MGAAISDEVSEPCPSHKTDVRKKCASQADMGDGMMRDRSPIWIGLADLLLCIVSVVIAAVAPTHAKMDGVKPRAEYLITADWDVLLDSDVDLWVVNPSRKPIFYGSRQADCADLDHDSLGFKTSLITLADGSTVRAVSNKEVTSIRCFEPGHWNIGVNLYSDRELAKGRKVINVRVEIVGLNPEVARCSPRTWFSIASERPSMSFLSTWTAMARSRLPILRLCRLRTITGGRGSDIFQRLRALLRTFARRSGARCSVDVPHRRGSPGGQACSPALLVALGCLTPYEVNSMLGLPRLASLAALPDRAELVAFVAHDEGKRVDLWLRVGDAPPCAYEIAIDDAMKKLLRDARDRKEHGGRVMLVKRAEHAEEERHGAVTKQRSADPTYTIDENAFALPDKGSGE